MQDLPILSPTPPQKTHGKGEGKFGAAQGSPNPEFTKDMSGGKATNEKIARHSQLRECQKQKSQYMQPESAKSQSGLGRATKAVKLDSQWSSYQRVGVNLGQPDQLLGARPCSDEERTVCAGLHRGPYECRYAFIPNDVSHEVGAFTNAGSTP